MKPSEGRLQTAEHILARTLEHRLSDAKFIISKFEENSGYMEIVTKEDVWKVNRALLQDDVNEIIKKNLLVSKHILTREDAEKEFDFDKVAVFRETGQNRGNRGV
jgi:Ser-tRNA(Ala) deacylase AlaX